MTKSRFIRDKQNKLLGGVTGGIARAIRLNYVPVRIALRFLIVVCMIIPLLSIIVLLGYVFLWLTTPTEEIPDVTANYKKWQNSPFDFGKNSTSNNTVNNTVKNRAFATALQNILPNIFKKNFGDFANQSSNDNKPLFTPKTVQLWWQMVQGNLPRPIFKKIVSIQSLIENDLPVSINHNELGFDQDIFDIRQTAYEYFPQTVDSYLQLSPHYAKTQPLADGKTAEEHCLEQLTLIETTLRQASMEYHERIANDVQINSRFLNEKFKNENKL